MTAWNTAEVPTHFRDVLRACANEPQFLREDNHTVAVLMDIREYKALKAHIRQSPPPAKKPKTMAEFMAELDAINAQDPIELEIPARVDRPNPFLDDEF